jgi:hypothetical protein
LVVAVVGLLFVTNAWGVVNYHTSKSNSYILFPDGLVTTATITFTAGAGEVVYTTPAEGDFVLTQFCADPDVTGGIRLTAANFGTIAQTTNGVGCYTFTPGVSIPENTALTCSTSSPAKGTILHDFRRAVERGHSDGDRHSASDFVSAIPCGIRVRGRNNKSEDSIIRLSLAGD